MTIYLDLDGVLCDFVGGCRRVHRIPDPWPAGQYDLPTVCGMTPADFWAPINDAGADFWATLEPTPWATALENFACSLGHVVILSSPALSPLSHEGKVRWMVRRYGRAFRSWHFAGEGKERLARPGDVLIDDHDGNVAAWTAAGGVGVLCPRPWNAAHALAGDPMGAIRDALAPPFPAPLNYIEITQEA